MDARDFVALTLLASNGRVQGKTKLQKLVYFVGILTGSLEELGYRPHFYGPYSDDVAYAVTQLKAIGALDQHVSDWGYSKSGFEVRRYDFTLNESGTCYTNGVSQRYPEVWSKIKNAIDVLSQLGDRDYMSLSIAAKTYFLIGENKVPVTDEEIAMLASKFGWNVSPDQVSEAIDDLVRLGVVRRLKQ